MDSPVVEAKGLEPLTLRTSSECSTSWAIPPKDGSTRIRRKNFTTIKGKSQPIFHKKRAVFPCGEKVLFSS